MKRSAALGLSQRIGAVLRPLVPWGEKSPARRRKKRRRLGLPVQTAEHWGHTYTAKPEPDLKVRGGAKYSCPLCEESIPQDGLKSHLEGTHPDEGRFTWREVLF